MRANPVPHAGEVAAGASYARKCGNFSASAWRNWMIFSDGMSAIHILRRAFPRAKEISPPETFFQILIKSYRAHLHFEEHAIRAGTNMVRY